MRGNDIQAMQRQLAAHMDHAHRAPDKRVRNEHRRSAEDLTDKIMEAKALR